jgi:hypothetical protein
LELLGAVYDYEKVLKQVKNCRDAGKYFLIKISEFDLEKILNR